MTAGTTGRLGLAGYARIVARLAAPDGATTAELMTDCQIGRNAALRIVHALHAAGLAHVCAWQFKPRAWPIQRWAFGGAPDVPLPLQRPSGRPAIMPPDREPRPAPPELLAFMRLITCLRYESTALELRDEVGLFERSVRIAVAQMRKSGLVHICGWYKRASGGAPVALYILGSGRDAKPPAPKGREKIQRDHLRRRNLRTTYLTLRMLPTNAERFEQRA